MYTSRFCVNQPDAKYGRLTRVHIDITIHWHWKIELSTRFTAARKLYNPPCMLPVIYFSGPYTNNFNSQATMPFSEEEPDTFCQCWLVISGSDFSPICSFKCVCKMLLCLHPYPVKCERRAPKMYENTMG